MLAALREQLVGSLQEVPEVMNFYIKNPPIFVDRTIQWITKTEQTLQKFRIPTSSLLATERGKILATLDGYRDPEVTDSKSTRKAMRATACLALSRIEPAIRADIHQIDEKFDHMRNKMAQLLAVSSSTSPIPLPPTEPKTLWLQKVWKNLAIQPETKGMYEYLNTALKYSDRLYLLEEVIDNLLSNGLPAQHTVPSPAKNSIE